MSDNWYNQLMGMNLFKTKDESILWIIVSYEKENYMTDIWLLYWVLN